MSINSMANAAVARRPDYPPSKRPPKTAAERAAAASKDPTPENQVSTTLKTLTTYVPTETLTLYVALVAALQRAQDPTEANPISLWLAFWVFFIFTPLAIWITYATKIAGDGKKLPILLRYWPKWEMVAGTIAYTAWAFGLPDSPFSQFAWYSSAVAGFIVLISSTLLGMLAGLFQRPLQATGTT